MPTQICDKDEKKRDTYEKTMNINVESFGCLEFQSKSRPTQCDDQMFYFLIIFMYLQYVC